jgi:hypothetical protein
MHVVEACTVYHQGIQYTIYSSTKERMTNYLMYLDLMFPVLFYMQLVFEMDPYFFSFLLAYIHCIGGIYCTNSE